MKTQQKNKGRSQLNQSSVNKSSIAQKTLVVNLNLFDKQKKISTMKNTPTGLQQQVFQQQMSQSSKNENNVTLKNFLAQSKPIQVKNQQERNLTQSKLSQKKISQTVVDSISQLDKAQKKHSQIILSLLSKKEPTQQSADGKGKIKLWVSNEGSFSSQSRRENKRYQEERLSNESLNFTLDNTPTNKSIHMTENRQKAGNEKTKFFCSQNQAEANDFGEQVLEEGKIQENQGCRTMGRQKHQILKDYLQQKQQISQEKTTSLEHQRSNQDNIFFNQQLQRPCTNLGSDDSKKKFSLFSMRLQPNQYGQENKDEGKGSAKEKLSQTATPNPFSSKQHNSQKKMSFFHESQMKTSSILSQNSLAMSKIMMRDPIHGSKEKESFFSITEDKRVLSTNSKQRNQVKVTNPQQGKQQKNVIVEKEGHLKQQIKQTKDHRQKSELVMINQMILQKFGPGSFNMGQLKNSLQPTATMVTTANRPKSSINKNKSISSKIEYYGKENCPDNYKKPGDKKKLVKNEKKTDSVKTQRRTNLNNAQQQICLGLIQLFSSKIYLKLQMSNQNLLKGAFELLKNDKQDRKLFQSKMLKQAKQNCTCQPGIKDPLRISSFGKQVNDNGLLQDYENLDECDSCNSDMSERNGKLKIESFKKTFPQLELVTEEKDELISFASETYPR